MKSKLLSNQISTIFKARSAKGAQRTIKLSTLSAYVKICLFFRQMAACVLEYFVDLQKTCTLVLCLFCNSAGRNSYLKIGICQLVFLICFIVFLRNNKNIMRPLPAEL